MITTVIAATEEAKTRIEDLFNRDGAVILSEGTLADHHLIPRFAYWLGVEDYDKEEDGLVDSMIEALQEAAPEGAYFGTHPGDGACFGFWANDFEPDIDAWEGDPNG